MRAGAWNVPQRFFSTNSLVILNQKTKMYWEGRPSTTWYLNAIDPEGRRNAKHIACIRKNFRSSNSSITNTAIDGNRPIQFISSPQDTATGHGHRPRPQAHTLVQAPWSLRAWPPLKTWQKTTMRQFTGWSLWLVSAVWHLGCSTGFKGVAETAGATSAMYATRPLRLPWKSERRRWIELRICTPSRAFCSNWGCKHLRWFGITMPMRKQVTAYSMAGYVCLRNHTC